MVLFLYLKASLKRGSCLYGGGDNNDDDGGDGDTDDEEDGLFVSVSNCKILFDSDN